MADHILSTDRSAVPFLSITMVCAMTLETSTYIYHLPYPTVTTTCLQFLTLHRRRMQGYHVILLEVYQITSRLQRPRVSQPVQVIPFLPHGPVRTLTMLSSYAPRIYPTYYTDCCKRASHLARSKGGKIL
jgi:hypothetical protein